MNSYAPNPILIYKEYWFPNLISAAISSIVSDKVNSADENQLLINMK